MTDGSGPEEARLAARVILTDRRGAVWLIRGRDPGDRGRAPFWFTPGGKIDPGESARAAAARELAEETGIVVPETELGEPVATEDCVYSFLGIRYRQHGVFFRLRHDGPVPMHGAGWTDVERQSILGARWWTADEIAASAEAVYPEHLLQILRGLPAGE